MQLDGERFRMSDPDRQHLFAILQLEKDDGVIPLIFNQTADGNPQKFVFVFRHTQPSGPTSREINRPRAFC
jgi:hypothetical protein